MENGCWFKTINGLTAWCKKILFFISRLSVHFFGKPPLQFTLEPPFGIVQCHQRPRWPNSELSLYLRISMIHLSLPHGKLVALVTDLRKLANGDKVQYSLRELERILGKLNHVSQLCPPLRTFISEATFLMGEHIPKLSDAQGNISDEDKRQTHLHCAKRCV